MFEVGMNEPWNPGQLRPRRVHVGKDRPAAGPLGDRSINHNQHFRFGSSTEVARTGASRLLSPTGADLPPRASHALRNTTLASSRLSEPPGPPSLVALGIESSGRQLQEGFYSGHSGTSRLFSRCEAAHRALSPIRAIGALNPIVVSARVSAAGLDVELIRIIHPRCILPDESKSPGWVMA